MAKSINVQLSSYDLKDIKDGATSEEIIYSYNSFIKYFNFFSKSLGISSSFNGFVAEKVVFQASGDAGGNDSQRIEHFLGFTPKFRLILRQEGNGVLEDTPSGWNESFVTLKNRGTEIVTATILLLRE